MSKTIMLDNSDEHFIQNCMFGLKNVQTVFKVLNKI